MRTRLPLAPFFALLFVIPALCQQPIPRFPLTDNPLHITKPALPTHPFTVAGDRAAIFGFQNGEFELWQYPVKILHGFHITAELENYSVPIDINQQASTIEVFPGHTTITYSHAAITVKQHMFATRGTVDTGNPSMQAAFVLFEIHAVRKAKLTFRFEPDLLHQWPAPNYGRPNASWHHFPSGDAYVLQNENPTQFAVIAMPTATPGILAPFQERPKSYPVEFHLAFDPKRDNNSYFPLLYALSDGTTSASDEEFTKIASFSTARVSSIRENWSKLGSFWQHFFDTRLTAETPDKSFDEALKWAEVSIEQAHIKVDGQEGLVAGWYSSGDSDRPGFGWFFGRDTLWTTYSLHSYGDLSLSKQSLYFLIQHQREDGKMMHEYPQSAQLAEWKALPYYYAAADATPLYLMAMDDYVRNSGDLNFLKSNWNSILRAYHFERAHTTDGIYDNSEGSGWVESWPPKMPHQELYLASLDQQSCVSMSRMALLMNDLPLSKETRSLSTTIRSKLAEYRQSNGFYAFSRNPNGTYDVTPTIFPSVAWWTGEVALPNAAPMFTRWASHDFSTDWGTRSVSENNPLYDPISYHQGTVWPLFTGWTSIAEYHANRPLAGYQHLMQNADLTWAQDLGAVTELLSGAFYEPLGRSSSHQLWSSAMVLTPAIRGLFGIETDALHKNIRLTPHLPASWNHAALHSVPFGNDRLEITMDRRAGELAVEIESSKPNTICFVSNFEPVETNCAQAATAHHSLKLSLPPLEIVMAHALPLPGASTQGFKIIDEIYERNKLTLILEAKGGSEYDLLLRQNKIEKLAISGAKRDGDRLHIIFPNAEGYITQKVEISWAK